MKEKNFLKTVLTVIRSSLKPITLGLVAITVIHLLPISYEAKNISSVIASGIANGILGFALIKHSFGQK